jgi:hypothetical protein
MKQHRSLIESQAGIVEFEEIQRLRKVAEVEFQNARDSDLDRRRSKVLQWLSPASSETIQEGCEKARSEYPGTGQWLLKEDKFNKWFDPNFCSNPLLWLGGIPGAGKLQCLQEKIPADHDQARVCWHHSLLKKHGSCLGLPLLSFTANMATSHGTVSWLLQGVSCLKC